MVGESKTTSWAVAVGVAAVEAMKDQVGLCRWNYAFRLLQQYAKQASLKTGPKSATNNNTTVNQARRLSGAIEHHHHHHPGVASVRAAREAEKADNVMHLVCWGPT